MTEDDKKLWQEMADLTMERCRKKCHKLGLCCEKSYCDLAKSFAGEHGVKLKATGNAVPFLDKDGKCIVPPHLRPLCTLHQCDINGLGLARDDKEWTERYFALRDRLEQMIG